MNQRYKAYMPDGNTIAFTSHHNSIKELRQSSKDNQCFAEYSSCAQCPFEKPFYKSSDTDSLKGTRIVKLVKKKDYISFDDLHEKWTTNKDYTDSCPRYIYDYFTKGLK